MCSTQACESLLPILCLLCTCACVSTGIIILHSEVYVCVGVNCVYVCVCVYACMCVRVYDGAGVISGIADRLPYAVHQTSVR